MAFTDPQSITVNAVARSLLRILTGSAVGTFFTADGVTTFTIDPSGTKARRIAKASIRENVNVTDPVTGLVSVQNHSFTIISNRPKTGISDALAEQLAAGLITWATASTNANLKKLLAGEN
jgi:H+/gluconate symporter-like permease